MSKGTLNLPDTHKDKIYAGLVEAVIGSVFIIEGTKNLNNLLKSYSSISSKALKQELFKDAKTFCKNILQNESLPLPEYHVMLRG